MIGLRTFGESGLQSVAIPSSVKEVHQSAFCLCKSLRSAVVCEGLETLGEEDYLSDGAKQCGIFGGSALKHVELPRTLKRIGYSVFEDCMNLSEIRLPEELEFIGKTCFARSGLQSVVFPSSLRTVAQEAFSGCRDLRKAVLNEGLETLGTDEYSRSNCMYDGVFDGSALEDVVLPPTLRRIEYRAFAECSNLKRVKLPEGLEYIGQVCFSNSGLEEISLPASVRTVGTAAFYGCECLRRAELNDGLQVLGGEWYNGKKSTNGAVFALSGLQSARIPSTVRVLEANTFLKCVYLRRVELVEGLEQVGACAFQESGVEEVVLPSSVRTVSAWAFAWCRHLRSVRLNAGLEVLGAEQRVLDLTYQGSVFAESALENLSIPSTLRALDPSTFEGCRPRVVEFLEGWEALGQDAGDAGVWGRLLRDGGVEEVVLPGTLREVGPSIFKGCRSLRVVRVARGCVVKVRKLVGLFVRVR